MAKRTIDVLFITCETCDTETVVSDLRRFSPRTVVVVGGLWDARPVYAHAPAGYGLDGRPFRTLTWNGRRFRNIVFPLLLLVNLGSRFLFLLRMGRRFDVRTVMLWCPYQGAMAGLLRRLGLFRRFVFLAGDWMADNALRSNLFSGLNSRWIHPALDGLCARLSDVTLNLSDRIAAARIDYWGKRVAKSEAPLRQRLVEKRAPNPDPAALDTMLFLGSVRADSGMEIVMAAMPDLRARYGLRLRIVGEPNDRVAEWMRDARRVGIEGAVDFAGRAERSEFARLFAPAFCGLNLITSRLSYTGYTVPAKILDYIQYLLPVIATENIGGMADVIRRYGLGVIVPPAVSAFIEAVVAVRHDLARYQSNLRDYIRQFPGTDLTEFLVAPDVGSVEGGSSLQEHA